MLQKLTIILVLLFSVLGTSQSTKLILIDSVQINADTYFGKDVLGYDYYAKNNVLFKQKGFEKWEYKNLPLGKIHSVDLINPLKILVFYKDFNSVVLLDNQLSEITKINLNDYTIVAQTCSVASRNQLWVYDNLSNSLLLLDYLNKKTIPLNQPFKNTFKYSKSDYNNWFSISEKNEIIVYDNYGRAVVLGSVPEFDSVILTQNRNMLFSLNDNLYLYKNINEAPELLFSNQKAIKSFEYNNGILSIFTGKTIENYTLNLP